MERPVDANAHEGNPITSEYDRKRLEKIFILDADVHVDDAPERLAPYCEMPWRKALEMAAAKPSSYFDIPGYSPNSSISYFAAFPGGHDGSRTVRTVGQLREALDAMFIDAAVIFPDNLLKIAMLPQADYACAIARAYNAWIVEEWCLKMPGIVGCIIAAPHDPAASAEEIRRYAGAPGIAGVYLPSTAVLHLWWDRRYDPIFTAAQEADLPVALHSVSVVHPNYPFNVQQLDTVMAQHTLTHPVSMMANIASMITSGVPIRFPELRIGCVEAGISWIPFIRNRLDKEYIVRRREVPFLRNRPSSYLDSFYFATQPIEEPENPRDLVDIVRLFNGERRTMFASDWSHLDFDHPRALINAGFEQEVLEDIMGKNALRFFRIDPATAGISDRLNADDRTDNRDRNGELSHTIVVNADA